MGEMDPYVGVEWQGRANIWTKTCENGGHHPKWNETLEISIPNSPEQLSGDVNIQCWDEDFFNSDLIGETSVAMQNLIKCSGKPPRQFNLFFNG